MNDIVRVKVVICTNRVGSECEDIIEFDRAAWESMTEDERQDECQDAAFNNMQWYWEEVE